MHEIDGPGSVGGQWVEKDPGLGVPGTTFTEAWQNTIQQEFKNAIEAAGIVLSKADNAQLLAAIPIIAAGAGWERRNWIINPTGRFSQRIDNGSNKQYTIDPTTETYWVDRWFAFAGTAGAAIGRRQAFAYGHTDVPWLPRHYMRFNVTTDPSSGAARFGQRIERLEAFSNQVLTISFYARSDAATDLEMEVRQNFGTGGGASAEVIVALTPHTFDLTALWQRFTLTITSPTVFGKVQGANGDDHLVVEFRPLGVTPKVDITNVQVEYGSTPTQITRRHHGEELELCRRYYEKSWMVDVTTFTQGMNGTVTGFHSATASTTYDVLNQRFQTEKRDRRGGTSPANQTRTIWHNGNDFTADEIRHSVGSDRSVNSLDQGTFWTGPPDDTVSDPGGGIATALWEAESELYEGSLP